MSTAAAHPLSKLPTRLPAHNGETLNSYITRAARRAHLSERHMLQVLGCRQQTLPAWLHVAPPFFTRLSHLTHETEATLRERLVDWSEGNRPARKGNQRTTHYTMVPGRGCPSCRALKDGARLSLADTELDHICSKHRIWADIAEAPGLSGRPASPDALCAAFRFRRWVKRRSPREAALAFNTAYAAIDRAQISGSVIPSLVRQAWDQRIDESQSTRLHLVEVSYPEIAEVAATLLSDVWLNPARSLNGHPKRLACESPASHQQFDDIALRVLRHVPSPRPVDIEWARGVAQRSILAFLETTLGSYTDYGSWTTERSSTRVDELQTHRRIDSGLLATAQEPNQWRHHHAVAVDQRVTRRPRSSAGL